MSLESWVRIHLKVDGLPRSDEQLDFESVHYHWPGKYAVRIKNYTAPKLFQKVLKGNVQSL